MLPLLIGLLVAAGPLLRGAWDLWAQSLLYLLVVLGLALWAMGRLFVGYFPLPSRRGLAWSAALIAAAGAAACLSPVWAYAVPAWRALALGLWIFPAVAAVSKDQRSAVDEAIRASAWVLLLLAFYQHYHFRMERPPSTFPNQNVFAGTILLLLPLAVQKRDWVLAGGLLLALGWTRSVGAWLGLAGALVASRRSAGVFAYWIGAAVGFGCLVAIYGKLQTPEVLHRWFWWAAAARMALARPLLGFGPGSYAYVLPAYQTPGRDLSSLYAHQHFLETAAECGLPYLAAWVLGLVHCLRRGGAHKRFGALAILIQSLWDYSLSIPSNLWLLCYFAASSSSETSEGVNVPLRRKLPAAIAVAALALVLGRSAWRRWEADRLTAQAVESYQAGRGPAAALALLDASARLGADPEAERLAAELELSRRDLRAAARHLERATALNPYRASNWTALEGIYRRLGDEEAARRKRREGAAFCPVLRT